MTRSVRAPRFLLLAAAGSAVLFTWAAVVLPSEPGTCLGALAALLSGAHALTLIVVLLRPEHWRLACRALSWLSLCAAPLFTGAVGYSAWVLESRFGNVGAGVAVLLGVIGVLLLLATVPFATWGLRATRKAPHAI